MHVVERFDDVLLNAFVIHRIAHGLAHLGLGEVGVFLVHAHVIDHRLRHGLEPDLAGFLQRHHVVGAELAGNVDIAFFQQQAAARGLGHMAQHHALHGSGGAVAVIAVQGQGLVGRPLVELEDARARFVGLEPAVAHVVALGLFGEQFFVDDRGRPAAQDGEHKGRRQLAIGGDGDGVRIHQLDVLQRVVFVQPNAGQHHGRALAQQRRALQRPGHIFCGDRVARVELLPRADLEGEGFAVFADAPGFGRIAVELAGLGQVGADQAVIGVGEVFHGHQLVDLGRVERGELVQRAGHHQHVLGRCRLRGRQPAQRRCTTGHRSRNGQNLSTNHCLHGTLLSSIFRKPNGQSKCRAR